MKNKLGFVLLVLLAVELLAGCATTAQNATPPYQFEGTAWTKTEDYELVFKGSNWEVWCGSEKFVQGDDMRAWKVDENTLTFGNKGYWSGWGHAAGEWTLKSGTPGANSLDGTTWTRTANLEIRFADKKMYAKDGDHITNANQDGDSFTVTSTEIRVQYSGGTAKGTYLVDGNNLTVTTTGYFGFSRLEGSPWTKK
jgi:hypothetical protein